MKCAVALRATLLASALVGCMTVPEEEPPPMATARVSSDFDSYLIRRVGLMPIGGETMTLEHAEMLQAAFAMEFSKQAPFEVVQLRESDVQEIPGSEPFRRGSYDPRTILEMSDRYRLDALIFGTVTQMQVFPPQQLGVEFDLVSRETGSVLWSSSLLLDARNRDVYDRLEAYQGDERFHSERGETIPLAWISPSTFAQFAAREVARVL